MKKAIYSIFLLLTACTSTKFQANAINNDYKKYELNNGININSIRVKSDNIASYVDGYYSLNNDIRTDRNIVKIVGSDNDPYVAIDKSLQTCINNVKTNNKNDGNGYYIDIKLNKIDMYRTIKSPQQDEIDTKIYYDIAIHDETGKEITTSNNSYVNNTMFEGIFSSNTPSSSFVWAEELLCNYILRSLNNLPNQKINTNTSINKLSPIEPIYLDKGYFTDYIGKMAGRLFPVEDIREDKNLDIKSLGIKKAIEDSIRLMINSDKMSIAVATTANSNVWEITPILKKISISDNYERITMAIDIKLKNITYPLKSRTRSLYYDESESIYNIKNRQDYKRTYSENVSSIMHKILKKMANDIFND